MTSIPKRDSTIDLIKSIALLGVVSIHFFLYSDFYETTVPELGLSGILPVFLRTLSTSCVPMFLIATGYLMEKKTFSAKYYVGITRTLIVYLISSIMIIAYRKYCIGEDISILASFVNILGFKVGYSWYIEMYIGLFLVIPFLNIVYKNLGTEKKRRALVIILVVSISFPPLLNFYTAFLPDWWSSGTYPIMYYFLGAYMRDYRPRSKSFVYALSLITWVGLFTLFNFYACTLNDDRSFNFGIYADWPSIQAVGTSYLVFRFIQCLRVDSWNRFIKATITFIAKCSLGAYLLSCIMDMTIYPALIENFGGFWEIFPYYPLVVFTIYVLSIVLSSIVTWIGNKLSGIITSRLICIILED